jgi:hypothetical protein
MKANEAFRKFFSLNTWRNITLYLLLFCLGTASILALAFYEPWRYLTFARSSDLILPKDPLSYPRLMIIESPHIDVAKHQEPIHPDLPPLYTDLPSDLPKEVTDYIEKRNSYIRQLGDKYTTSSGKNSYNMTINELLPYEYNGKEGFFAYVTSDMRSRLSLFDSSVIEVKKIFKGIPSSNNIASARFLDRFWPYDVSSGASSLWCSCAEVIYQNELSLNSIRVGYQYDDFDIDPFSTMKIINKSTDPKIKTHQKRSGNMLDLIPSFIMVSLPIEVGTFILIAYWWINYITSLILRPLLYLIAFLFLLYLLLSLSQKHKQKKQSHGN